MDVLIKLNNQTAGRDKIARLLQYMSRVLWHNLQTKNSDSVNSIKNLEFQLSTFRKLLRFGRCIDSLYATLPLFQYEDPTIRTALILGKISNALFLLADHFLWMGRADVCSVNTEKWSKISNKYWLYSITMNLVRDIYEIYNILKSDTSYVIPAEGIRSFNDLLRMLNRSFTVLQQRQNRSILIDTIKNGCDFFIPLTALGHARLSPGTIGLLGTVSSLAGLAVLIDPLLKLSPS